MEKAPGFGAMLARLLSHKGLSAGLLARRIGIPESDLQAVLDGAAPDGSLIWRLAPELGLHVADLFVIAGMPVPEDLAPVDAGIGRLVARFVLAASDGADLLRGWPDPVGFHDRLGGAWPQGSDSWLASRVRDCAGHPNR